MRVVLDARVAADHFPGIGRVAIELARALHADRAGADHATGPAIEVVCLAPPGPSRLGPLPAPRIECAASPFSLAQQWVVPRALARAGAGAYHSLFYLMPLRPGVPTVLTCHDLIPLVRPETQPGWKRLAFAATFRAALARAAAIVAVSEATRRDLCERLGTDPARVQVIPNGVSAEFAPASPEAVTAVRTRLGLDRPYLLFVGSNKPHKNLVRLVAAFAQVAPRRPDVDLVVAGVWDPRYPEARAASRDAGLGERVRFLGPVADADLAGLYTGAHAFVFPSLYEGFGLPVLEAMACGAPTISGSASSLPEVAGDAALLVDATDVEALAAALDRLLEDEALRADLARRGVARAATFTWERSARAYRAAYATLAAE